MSPREEQDEQTSSATPNHEALLLHFPIRGEQMALFEEKGTC